MESGLLLGGVLLAGVFATASVAKLADLAGSRAALISFGIPRALAAPLGALLPIAELATAGLLVAGVAANSGEVLRAGALSALVLLTLFCAGIALSLLRGRSPDCHCFGQLHSAPAGGRTLYRNGALLTLAAFLAGGGEAVWTFAAAVTALTVLGAVMAIAPTRGPGAASDGHVAPELPLGTAAPGFELPRRDGSVVSLETLRRRGRPVLLVFTDPRCGPCLALAPDIATWQRRHATELTIAVVESRDGETAPAADEHGREDVLLQRESEVADAYRASGTPTAVLVGPEGDIASSVAGGATAIEALVTQNVTGRRPNRQLAISRRSAPEKPGGRLIRRELLLRGAGAWAASGAALAWPLRAVAGATAGRGRHCRRDADCGRKQKCVGQGQNARCKCSSDAFPDECGRDCTNFQTDDRNCGDCGGTECIPGRATCVRGDCVSGNTDPDNCAGLGCTRGEVCCEIPTGNPEALLHGCIDLKDDVNHCGACNRPCNQGKTPMCCGGKCVDAHGDPGNCGGCGNACKEGESCYQGKCVKDCPPGLRGCKTGDLRTCYRASAEICCGGNVVSTEGYTNPQCCGGEIVDHGPGSWFCP